VSVVGQAGPVPTPAQPSPAVAGVGHAPPSAAEACPLCGSPLQREQDWCLRCGAAARTRLSATPNWKAPLAALIAVAAVLLGVLAAALIALAHGPGPAPVTRTVIVVPGAGTTGTTPAPGASTPGTTTPAPGTGTPTTTTPAPGAGTTGTTGATATPGSGTTTPTTTPPTR